MFTKQRYASQLLLLSGVLTWPGLLLAECRIDRNFGSATHFLVNGLINKPVPEINFVLPGSNLGNGVPIISDSVLNEGGNRTLGNHIRFRLRVKNSSSTGVAMYADSSSPLSCVNCSSIVSIPFSKLGWTEGSASETKGNTPGNGQLTGGVQNIIHGSRNSDSVFNLQFNFANDEIYPAGTYEGTFYTRGIPQ